MAGASCCGPRPGQPPAWPCVPLASHCRPACSRSPATDCRSGTCSATPPPARRLSRPFNHLRERTVEDGFGCLHNQMGADGNQYEQLQLPDRSATIASVVTISAPTDAACCSADRTTFVGSMIPALTMSLNSPVCASKPQLYSSLSSTLPEITAPSSPEFSAIWRSGR